MRPDRRRRAGLSLIELVVAIVVIGVALTGTMLVVDTTTRRSADPLLERQALAIANAYLEEIAGKDYLDPDTGALCASVESSRDRYDDVCDYDGLDETGARDQNGLAIAGLTAYRVEIDVDRSARLGGVSGATNLLRIDATVTDPTGRVLRLSTYRANP